MFDPTTEPLELSAPLARQFAAESCRRDPQTGESCAWYHGFWQYLRLLDMGTTPAGHADLFRHAFSRAPKHSQVLVAGGADYGMLAQAQAACAGAAMRAEFTMVDWCETPLALARWYAERESISLRTEQLDLLQPGDEERFDIACTQALLGHFAPSQRPALLRNIRRALRPGGFFVTAQRLRPDAPDVPVRFAASQVEEFARSVAARAGGIAGIDAAWLESAARDYAARQQSWPVRSAAEVRMLLEDAGFRVVQISDSPMLGGGTALNMPTVASGALYARVIALRS